MTWSAALELGFSADGGTTRLARRAHRGPYVVQRPFFPEGREVCHVYLLHPPGGLVGGDELRLDLRVDAGAHALVTTPAAGKAYRTLGPVARQAQTLTVEAGGALEWLPQETILYDGCRVEIDTRIELGAESRFFGADTFAFGLPARGEPFARGFCRVGFDLRRQGVPILIERGRFEGGAPVLRAPWGLGAATVMTTIVAAPAPEDAVVEALRGVAASETGRAAVTILGEREALVVRHLGARAEEARAFVLSTWHLVRPALLGRAAVVPRIWAT